MMKLNSLFCRLSSGTGWQRCMSVTSPNAKPKVLPNVMSAWQIYQYGGIEQLTLTKTIRMPAVTRPHEVLVEIHAASINPIDTRMLAGFGSTVLNVMRRVNCTLHSGSEFPLVLGRDFSGQIVDIGQGVRDFKVGDEVWGAGNVAYPGTHAQYLTISSKEISRKPKTLSHVEAGSLPYVIGTTWSAVCTAGRLNETNARGKRVLILGGSGGIGTFAIQLMKAWGAEVTTTCSTDAVQRTLELGADVALDYTLQDLRSELEHIKGFDLIFDAVGGEYARYAPSLLKPYSMSQYVTIVNGFLGNTDHLGFVNGVAKSALDLGTANCKVLPKGSCYHWVFFIPSGTAMRTVAKLVDDGRVVPIVEKVFAFAELPAAYENVMSKHKRGKIVVDMMT